MTDGKKRRGRLSTVIVEGERKRGDLAAGREEVKKRC